MKTTSPLPGHPFLKNLDSQIETHLSDNDLTVGRLTRLVGMSRTDLHRKLKRAVGLSATAYMRQKRLEKAAELLAGEPDRSICRVAMEVGFDNHSYFTKRFRERFGRSPKAWATGSRGGGVMVNGCIKALFRAHVI